MSRFKLRFTILALAILTAFTIAVQAGAEPIKGRVVFHYVKMEVIQVGDVPGHVIGVADAAGLTFDDIENKVGTFATHVLFDSTKGNGTHWGYDMRTYDDGSMITKFQGTTMAGEGEMSSFQGTSTFTKGTGRYEGIQGGTSYAGKGGPTGRYADVTGSYTLPPR